MSRSIDDISTIQEMIRYGGSFVQALGRAAQAADSDNLKRIKAGWPEYWQKYESQWKRRKQHEKEEAARQLHLF